MKTTFIALLCALSGFGQAAAQTKADTLKVLIKVKELKQKELALKQKIETEDKKRNQTIAGVSEVSMAAINERQDSICLDLRSQLVDVQLQVKELDKSIRPVQGLTPTQAAENLQQGLNVLSSGTCNNPGKQSNRPKKKNE